MNQSDSERIARVLESIGYKSALNINRADLIVVNMCSVRQSAVDRVYGLWPKFHELKKKNKKLKTLLTGCILKKDFKTFKNLFDLILSIKSLANWGTILGDRISFPRSDLPKLDYLKIPSKYKTNFSALIPISNGCNNFCSYCVVPFVRGPLVCRDHKEILDEVKEVIQKGFKEIWLLGQNVNDYLSPIDSSVNFTWLLKMVNDIPGDFWIRFTSPHPKNFSEELVGIMAECDKITEYLNLPVQSGDDEILKKMNRNYRVKDYKTLVKKIREKVPNIALSTDIIVGFPGETKKQFENTLKLFKEIKFDMAYIAQYSSRPGTAATKLKDNISGEEKERRWKVLADVLKETALENNKKYIGKKVKVLVDKKEKDFLFGKSKQHKTLKFKGNENLIGQFVSIKITEATPWGLKGELLIC